MTEDEFWQVIAASQPSVNPRSKRGRSQQLRRLRGRLMDMPLDEIVAFDRIFRQKITAAYRWDLWGVAYVVMDGCSDDCFEYFCRWLISTGREMFEQAVNDPDSLGEQIAGWSDDALDFEEFGYVAADVFEEKTGEEMPAHDLPLLSEREPIGERGNWDDDAVVQRRFPRTMAQLSAER